jgi:hypothetical protein
MVSNDISDLLCTHLDALGRRGIRSLPDDFQQCPSEFLGIAPRAEDSVGELYVRGERVTYA